MKKCLLGLLILSATLPVAWAQSLAHTRESRFGKGANLSNWLEAYWMGAAWPQPAKYQKQDLQAMKEAGMATVRLPFCFAMITDTLAPPYTVDFNSPGIAWLDSVIAWTDALGMNLIICNQHGWDVTNGNYAAKLVPMTAMWRQVAQHYAGLDPERYFFEMLNEPPVGLLPANADAVNLACIDTVRKYAPHHSLIVGPHTASIGSSYLTFSPYPDTNLIYTFHTYEPLYFTHQGFTWMTPQFPTGVPFPFLGDDGLLRTSLDAVANWRDTNAKPVFMGEFGVGIHADANSRCNWITLLGQLIDDHGFHALAWDWGGVAPSDFSMFQALPATQGNIDPCFAEAMHFYEPTQLPSVTSIAAQPQLWPNPAHDRVQMTCEAPVVAVDCYDLHGRWMRHEHFPVPTHNPHFSVAGLSPGMYVVQLRGRNGFMLACPVWVSEASD